ncbi:hypothetical protein TNCV_512931 [Trichonephila clavipes]|nr:hypothetical protein TNCV_512931 [Trichonephila clavipes]
MLVKSLEVQYSTGQLSEEVWRVGFQDQALSSPFDFRLKLREISSDEEWKRALYFPQHERFVFQQPNGHDCKLRLSPV